MHVREASPDDAADLLSLWSDSWTRSTSGGRPDAEAEAVDAIARIAADPDQRLLVAEVGGQVAGAAFLVRAPVAPLSTEVAIYLSQLHVREASRRQGAGRALLEATVSWAEEKAVAHVFVAAPASSREANRFMARLGLAQVGVIRGASVAALRGKLPVECPHAARSGGRTNRAVGQVLARRRIQRRTRSG